MAESSDRVTIDDVRRMLIEAKCPIRAFSIGAISDLADLIRLLKLESEQRAADFRAGGRRQLTPEAELAKAADDLVALLKCEIDRSANTALLLEGHGQVAGGLLNVVQVDELDALIEHILDVRDRVFAPVVAEWGDKWVDDAQLLFGKYKSASGTGSSSKNGPAVRFIYLALKSCGWRHEISDGSIEQALTRRLKEQHAGEWKQAPDDDP